MSSEISEIDVAVTPSIETEFSSERGESSYPGGKKEGRSNIGTNAGPAELLNCESISVVSDNKLEVRKDDSKS